MAHPPPPLDDEQLFARFRASGDAHALGELFDRTAPALLRVALHLTRDPATAEDLLQDTFLRAIEARDEWDAARPLLPWLCGVLHNRARRERWQRGRAPDPLRVTTPNATDPAHAAQRAEFDAAVDAAIAELPEAYRPVLRLHLAYAQPPAAIAHALERPPATVRSQLARGLEQLRRVLPAGFAGGAALALTTQRGLAAVKQLVITHAHAVVPATVAAGTMLGGMLTMKKLATIAAAAMLAAGLWLCWPQPDLAAPGRSPDGQNASAAHASLPRAAPVADAAAQAAREESVTPSTATTGALRIRCRFADDGTLAFGVQVTATPRLLDSTWLQRRVKTGDDGSVLVADLPAATIDVAADRGGRLDAKVVAGATTDVELAIPAGVLVRGRVVDEHGAPVATAQVWLSEGARDYCDGTFVTRVDADGRFVLRNVETERFVSATAPGLRNAAVLPVRPASDHTFDVELVLRGAGATLSGRVLDANGAPAAGARVLVGWRSNSMGWNPHLLGSHRPPPALVADANGAFAAHGLPPGKPQMVWVRSPGHCLWAERITLQEEGDTSLLVKLQTGAALAGRASRPDGGPAARVSIDYVSSAWSTGSPPVVDFFGPGWSHSGARTDADGRYRIDCITPGTLRLIAYDEHAPVRGEVVAVAGETATWDPVFAPPETAAIRGRVVDERGAARSGVDVSAYPPRGQGNLGSATTDADGRFVCERLSSVPHVVKLFARGAEVAARWGVLPGPDELLVQVADAAMPSSSLTGTVRTADGEALAGARVSASRQGTPSYRTVTADAQGAFRLEGLQAGTWRLQIQVGEGPAAHRSAWSEPIELARGEARDLGALPMPATGTIVVTATGPDGKPLQGLVAIEDSTGWSENPWLAGMLAAELRIDGVAPGAHRVKVWTNGVPAHYHPVTVVAGQEVRADVRVPKGVPVKLVLSPVSDAVPVYEHFTWLRDGALLHRYENWWEANGELTWNECLAPGHYELTIVSETGKRSQVAFTVGPDDPPDREVAIHMP